MTDEAGLLPRLAAELDALAAARQSISYGALAAKLAIPGPGSINVLTNALELLMDRDAAANRPMRAALCEGRMNGGLPAQGFFDKASILGHDTSNPGALVAAMRQSLFNLARS